MKPEDRRYIFEEASGISRFKQQSEDAARKLAKTDENMAQVDLLLKEAEKVYNSRKLQLDKVIKNRRRIRPSCDIKRNELYLVSSCSSGFRGTARL